MADAGSLKIVNSSGVEITQNPAVIKLGAGLESSMDGDTLTINPSGAFHIVAAGQHTTAGGDTAEQATVAGALASDIVICSLEDNGTNDSTLISGAAASNAVNFVLNEDPGTDVIINYMVLRAL